MNNNKKMQLYERKNRAKQDLSAFRHQTQRPFLNIIKTIQDRMIDIMISIGIILRQSVSFFLCQF